MELLNEATVLASAAVLVITELLKIVPIQFTSKYPAWVNGIVSVIASLVVVKPSLDPASLAEMAGTALVIAVVAALAYNQYTSKVVSLGSVRH